jgi:hypothetical protein
LYRGLGKKYLNKEAWAYFVKMSFRKDFKIIFLRENVEFKKKISKMVEGKVAVWLSWSKGKWVTALGKSGKGRRDRERKVGQLREIGPKS